MLNIFVNIRIKRGVIRKEINKMKSNNKEHIFLKDKYSKLIFNDKDCKDYIIAILSKVLNVKG